MRMRVALKVVEAHYLNFHGDLTPYRSRPRYRLSTLRRAIKRIVGGRVSP
jgi:hypothetical protein